MSKRQYETVIINNVIWCTGFVTDYNWIDVPVFDDFGFPVRKRGVVYDQPGLYFIGMPFQSTLSPSLLMGVGRDAEYIARHIAANRSEQEIKFSSAIPPEVV